MARPSGWRVPLLIGVLGGAIVAVTVATATDSPRTAPTAAGSPAPPPDAGVVTRGRRVYLQYCASCHGANAQGVPNWQQPDPRGNLPPPPHDDTGHTWRHGDAQLVDIIRHGQRDVFNRTPELTMPPFKDRLSDDEIAAVIAYVKSLWSLEHRRYQARQTHRQPMATPVAGG